MAFEVTRCKIKLVFLDNSLILHVQGYPPSAGQEKQIATPSDPCETGHNNAQHARYIVN